MIENGKGDKPANKTAKTTYRDYKNFDIESFKVDLQGTDWTFATHNYDLNLGFEAFLRLFNTPIKELTKKEEKDKLKPWVTKGTKKIYVSQRQNLQTNDKRKRSADKNRKTQKIFKNIEIK